MTHRADEVVADALGEGAVGQQEGGSAAMLICRRRKKKTGQQDPEPETAAVADKVFDETCQPEERQRRPGRGKKERRAVSSPWWRTESYQRARARWCWVPCRWRFRAAGVSWNCLSQ
jgi:hypothetical protein